MFALIVCFFLMNSLYLQGLLLNFDFVELWTTEDLKQGPNFIFGLTGTINDE